MYKIKKENLTALFRAIAAEQELYVPVKTAGKVCGYAVQLGCYSDQASAEKAREAVGLEGLQIVEQRNMYKVIGKICKSKEDARSQMAELPEGTKGFVTEVYE